MAGYTVGSMTRLVTVQAVGGGFVSWWLADLTKVDADDTDISWAGGGAASNGILAAGPGTTAGAAAIMVNDGGSGAVGKDAELQSKPANNKGMTLVLPGVGASMKFRAGEDGAAGDAIKNDSENLQIVCVFRE